MMKFKTRAEIKNKIEKYFESKMEDGEIVKPVTLSSLAVHLEVFLGLVYYCPCLGYSAADCVQLDEVGITAVGYHLS